MDGMPWVVSRSDDVGSAAGRQIEALWLAVGAAVENTGKVGGEVFFACQDLFN